jgi:hypothetical protein
MTFGEFKDTPFAESISKELDSLKEKFWLKYDTEEMLAAVYFSFLSVKETTLRKDVDDSLSYYIKNYNDVLKGMLTGYFKIGEEEYLQWAIKRYNPYTNSLRLHQECGLFTATYSSNKDLIH